MKKYILSALMIFAAAQFASAQKGFVPLFDGKTMTGWHTYNKTTVGSAWEVVDGTIHMT